MFRQPIEKISQYTFCHDLVPAIMKFAKSGPKYGGCKKERSPNADFSSVFVEEEHVLDECQSRRLPGRQSEALERCHAVIDLEGWSEGARFQIRPPKARVEHVPRITEVASQSRRQSLWQIVSISPSV